MRKNQIFISYRRNGGFETAKHLRDLLVNDGYRVTFDIDSFRRGAFDIQLYEKVDECKDFILIVDAHAFDRCLNEKTLAIKKTIGCVVSFLVLWKREKILFLSFYQE